MTEECMQLVTTELRGTSSLMLSFSINRFKLKFNESIRSRNFNIHSIGEICFFLKLSTHNIHYEILTRKHPLAKNLIVQLHVVCENPKFDSKLSCTEEWCEKTYMGWVGTEIKHLHILIYISVLSSALINMQLYEDEEFTDFKLSTDVGSLPVHKAHLVANSDVFKMMLSREWKETSEGRVQIEGVSLQTLKHLKQYMYLRTLPDEGLLPLLLIARYYLIDNLKAECLMKISQTVTSENLYEILEYSFVHKIPELMFNVLETMPKYIVKDAHEIMMKNQKNSGLDAKTKTDKNNCNNE
ncbi:BTB and MATH domain-containing protein 42-like [Cydia strobilella]|uniref:BTB and MATH domain-containing protein 42-like n=1 Tax=Cydia strobilella TaxID=1100964 RepID=UPI0030074984